MLQSQFDFDQVRLLVTFNSNQKFYLQAAMLAFIAVRNKHEAAFIKKSIEYFKDVGESEVNEKRDDRGRLAIHVAAGCGNNLLQVKRLLSLRSDMHSKDNYDNTLLHEAAKYNRGDSHFDMIKLLLESGAEVNAQNLNGKTPLHFLILRSNVKTVNLLLDFGADVNIKDKLGETFLFDIISFRSQNLEVYKLLLDYGLDVNNLNKENMTPLHIACQWRSLKLVKFLVKNGANVNSLNSHEHTPLMMVLEYYNPSSDWVRFLIKYSDVNTIDNSGKNVLCLFYRERNSNVWKTILEHVAKLQALDLPIHQKLYATISSQPEYQEYFKQCNEELLLAKSTEVKNYWVTYFNLLLDSRRKLKNYAGNRDLVECFKNSDCLNKFPIYGADMIKKVNKGIQTRKSFDKSTVELSCCLPIFDPTHLIIKDVLDRLTSKDYNRLILEV